MISETGWTWDEVRAVTLRRLWTLFGYWAERDGGDASAAGAPPPPSAAEVAAALSRVPWRS